MTRWSVWELQLAWLQVRTRHLVGTVVEEQCGRVTSAVLTIDFVSQAATTASGRIFTLQGPPGIDPDAQYMLVGFLRLRGASGEKNVTAEVSAAMSSVGA